MSLPPPPAPPPPPSPPPPRPGDEPVQLVDGARRYDLDALRAVAMLLGIVLHSAIAFLPYYDEGDTGSSVLFALFEYIHLWRMPLFFVLSGYFTALLWRRRGLRPLLRQRAERIALPLALLYVPIIVLVVAGFIVGAAVGDVDLDDLSQDTAAYEDPNAGDEEQTEEEAGDGFSFAHMWFLWHLLWLLAGFAAFAWVADRTILRRDRAPPAILGRLLTWFLPLVSLVPFSQMSEDTLGPDTSEGLVPAAHVLGFYATFFAFGCAMFRHDGATSGPIDRLGRWWPAQLATSVIVFVLLDGDVVSDELSEPLEVALAWTVSFAMIGAFRQRMAVPSFRARWLSDASYYMYLVHLPIVFVMQGVVMALGLAPIPAFIVIVAVTVSLLVPSYRFGVRYTPIGRLLNGRRTPDGDVRLRAAIAVSQAER